MLAKTEEEMDKLYENVLKDITGYIDVVGSSVRRVDNGYLWHRIGDIHLAYEKPSVYYNRFPRAYVLAKDIAIAPSGLYFMDLESYDKNEHSPADKLEHRQEMYLTLFLRDFSIILMKLRYNNFIYHSRRFTRIINDLIDTSNRSDCIEMHRDDKNEEMRIKVTYPQIDEKRVFRIPYSRFGFKPGSSRVIEKQYGIAGNK